MSSRFFSFAGAQNGEWRVQSLLPVRGEALEWAPFLSVHNADVREVPGEEIPDAASWILRGVVSNTRYATRAEQNTLAAVQEPLGRECATCAALIPISKNAAWWALSQDDRRELFEERSHHTQIGLRYLPAIARRLHHGRDLGEPFDFLTWFEYAPAHRTAFGELVEALRQSEEWKYVEREVDIRLERRTPETSSKA